VAALHQRRGCGGHQPVGLARTGVLSISSRTPAVRCDDCGRISYGEVKSPDCGEAPSVREDFPAKQRTGQRRGRRVRTPGRRVPGASSMKGTMTRAMSGDPVRRRDQCRGPSGKPPPRPASRWPRRARPRWSGRVRRVITVRTEIAWSANNLTWGAHGLCLSKTAVQL
jgi:hypothetical protein